MLRYLIGERGQIVGQVQELLERVFRVLVKLLEHGQDEGASLLFGAAQQRVEEAVQSRRLFAFLQPKSSGYALAFLHRTRYRTLDGAAAALLVSNRIGSIGSISTRTRLKQSILK